MSDRDVSNGLELLAAEVAGYAPEDINEGPQTAPSKRILEFIPEYAKAQVGPLAAKAIGVEKLRQHCPHFNEWLASLEQLG